MLIFIDSLDFTKVKLTFNDLNTLTSI